MDDLTTIRSLIVPIPHFPKPNIIFRDISPLLANNEERQRAWHLLAQPFIEHKIDVVVGIESRGFIVGMALADRLQSGFVMARKPGKLPTKTYSVKYGLEYGKDELFLAVNAFEGYNRPRVLIADDLLATGGTLKAAVQLVEQAGGVVVGITCLVELEELGGRKFLEPYSVTTLVSFRT